MRKLHPEKVRVQLRCFLSSVTDPKSRRDIFRNRQQSPVETSIHREAEDDLEPKVAVLTGIDREQTCTVHVADTENQLMSTELTTSSEGESGRHGQTPRPSDLPLTVPSVIVEGIDADGGGGNLLLTPSPSNTPRNKSPVTVQEWVDSLPLTPVEAARVDDEPDQGEDQVTAQHQDNDDNLTLGAEAVLICGGSIPPTVQVTTCREPSETGSHCSSVESLLEARKPDPEEILLGLGFGGPAYSQETARIPQRFLQPSKLRGVTIDDFLKHQQEMIQNFESGFCGYRGLTGPSHTMPSVIVAKIMEKLREHERENSSIVLPHHVSDRNISTDKKNKFSRVARNVLTKIRCVPGSVLTPDNRKWLDSQGDKSPEISRKRIIIGQQSFTFNRDGDLIESQSPPSSFTDSDRWTSSTGTPGHQKHSAPETGETKAGFPSIQEDSDHRTSGNISPSKHELPEAKKVDSNKNTFANIVSSLLSDKVQESKLSASSSFEVSDEDKHWTTSVDDSGLPSSGRSSRGLDEFEAGANISQNIEVDSELVREPKDCQSVPEILSRNVVVIGNQVTENFSELPESADITDLNENRCSDTCDNSLQDKNSELTVLSNNEKYNFQTSQCSNSSENTSLHSSEMSSTLLLNSSWPSLHDKENISDVDMIVTKQLHSEPVSTNKQMECVCSSKIIREKDSLLSPPVQVIESLDKVIESLEKIMEPLEVFTEGEKHSKDNFEFQCEKEKLQSRYQDLYLLHKQLLGNDVYVDIGTESQFIMLTPNEQCELQCRVVQQALRAYHSQLANDEMHFELKTCLGNEVQKLADLLHTSSNPDRLASIVTQMTVLLKHQSDLGTQLQELSAGQEPLSCHQLCEVVMRRIRGLELLVRRNTKELAEMKKRTI